MSDMFLNFFERDKQRTTTTTIGATAIDIFYAGVVRVGRWTTTHDATARLVRFSDIYTYSPSGDRR
jgi:hypothetical protein